MRFLLLEKMKKIILIFLIIGSLSFFEPKPVEAFGGIIMKPTCELLTGVGDAVMNILHRFLIGQEQSVIKIDMHTGVDWRIFKIIVAVAIGIAIGVGISMIASIGIGAVVGELMKAGIMVTGSLSALTGIIMAISVAGTFYVGTVVFGIDFWEHERAVIPIFAVTPEEIFGNDPRMPLFSVNFFNVDDTAIQSSFTIVNEDDGAIFDNTSEDTKKTNFNPISKEDLTADQIDKIIKKEIKDESVNYTSFLYSYDEIKEGNYSKDGKYYEYHEYYKTVNDVKYMLVLKNYSDVDGGRFTFYKGTDVDSVQPTGNADIEKNEKNKMEKHSFAYDLRSTIAAWYRVLRTIATVGMMSVLIYIGIRILISSTANQKAKYKQLLGDWIVGMVLLFSMHIIMSFANAFVDELSKFLNNTSVNGYTAIVEDKDTKIETALERYGITVETTKGIQDDKTVFKFTESENNKKKTYIEWNTNLMGIVRMCVAQNENIGGAYVGYTLMYLVLIIYTISFAFTYIKRVIYMAFLTLISPFVALTYPIDKATDNSAQGFNFWFREYMFNLMLQPLHLLIYTIFVSSSIKLAAQNWVYAIIVIGFISSAEKIMRQMFNFQKAKTPGLLSGPVGGALTFAGMRKLLDYRFGKDARNSLGKLENNSKDSYYKDGLYGTSRNNELSREALSNINVRRNIDEGDIDEEDSNRDFSQQDTSPGLRERGSLNANDSLEEEEQYHSENTDTTDLDTYALDDLNDPNMFNGYNFDFSSLGTDEELWAEMLNNSFGSQYNKLKYMNPSQRKQAIDKYRLAKGKRILRLAKIRNKIANGNNKIAKVTSAGRDAMGFYKDGMSQKFERLLKNAQPIRNIARMTGGAISGLTFGTIGLGAGIASGDVKNAFQYAFIGATGGYKLGASSVDAIRNSLSVPGTNEQILKSYLGLEEYRDLKISQNQMKFIKDENNITKVAKKLKLSRREAKLWLLSRGKRFLDDGIDDVEDMIAIQIMIDDKSQFSYYDALTKMTIYGRIETEEQAIAAYKVSNMYRTDLIYGEENIEAVVEEIQNMGLTREQALTAFYASDVYNDIKAETYDNKNIVVKGKTEDISSRTTDTSEETDDRKPDVSPEAGGEDSDNQEGNDERDDSKATSSKGEDDSNETDSRRKDDSKTTSPKVEDDRKATSSGRKNDTKSTRSKGKQHSKDKDINKKDKSKNSKTLHRKPTTHAHYGGPQDDNSNKDNKGNNEEIQPRIRLKDVDNLDGNNSKK